MTPLLEVRGLRAGYEGISVVFGVDLEVAPGEVVALLGSNGAGKTTTLRAISGMIRPMAGEVFFDGERIDGRTPERIARGGLLHVPEGRGIFPTLTVGDTLRLAAALSGAEDASARIEDAVSVFPRLAERRDQLAGTLSGGEQQMLALARGLIARPKLLMIDEMSQGLAPTLVAELFERVTDFAERGVAVLLVEQFVGQALAVAERAYVLEKGEIAYAGPASRLARDESFVRGSYLGEAGGGPSRPPSERFRKPVTVSLPPALIRTLEERAKREGVEVGELISRLAASGDGSGRRDGEGSRRRRSSARPPRRRAPRGLRGRGGRR